MLISTPLKACNPGYDKTNRFSKSLLRSWRDFAFDVRYSLGEYYKVHHIYISINIIDDVKNPNLIFFLLDGKRICDMNLFLDYIDATWSLRVDVSAPTEMQKIIEVLISEFNKAVMYGN